MLPFSPVDLTPSQIRSFRKAFADGTVDTSPLMNHLNTPAARALMAAKITNLPLPYLDPVHFHFTGNRAYVNQVVSNGSVFGVLSQQRLPPSQRNATHQTARLEIVTHSPLAFLKVTEVPDDEAVLGALGSFVVWCAERARHTAPGLQRFARQLLSGADTPEAQEIQAAALDGRPVGDAVAALLHSVHPKPRRPR